MPEDAETPRTSPRTARARADFGTPIDSFFERQPPAIRAILEELRRLIMQAAPDAQSSIKWGNPWFTIDGQMFCALTAHKAHVNLILYGEPQAFADPEGWLAGEGAGGRHLKLSEASEIPGESVARWLRTAAEVARAKHGR